MLLASCTLDDMVKIIDVSTLKNRIKADFNEEEYEQSVAQNLKENHGKLPEEERKNTADDGEDNWESGSDDSDSDMDDSSDDDKKKQKKKDTKLNPKKNTLAQTKRMVDDQKRKDFFEDL